LRKEVQMPKYIIELSIEIKIDATSEDDAIQLARGTINSIFPSDFIVQDVTLDEDEDEEEEDGAD
jgi:hypothetical protein